jgi:DNA-directed RNA polymerase specialized sigma24 family protein
MTVSSRSRREDLDECVLLAAACAGDQQAFGMLLERYRPGLEVLCGLMLGDPQHADDAMGEAVLTAWRERGLATTSPSVRMWLYRIALRACTDALGCPAMSFYAGER